MVDKLTGISVMLPSAPMVGNGATTARGDKTELPVRSYESQLSDGRGVILFHAIDAPGMIMDVDEALRGVASGVTVTNSRHFDYQGHPAVDGRFTIPDQGRTYVNLIRFIADRGHLVAVQTVGTPGEESALSRA